MSKSIKKIAGVAAPLALSYFAPGIGTALGASLGATGATASALGGGLIGAGLGAVSGGGLKGALLGGATGGLGGYLSGGGLGAAAGTPLGATNINGALQGPTQGTGVLGAVTRNVPSGLGSALKSAVSGTGGNLLSGAQSYMAQSEAEKKLKKGQQAAQAALQPYLSAGTSGINALQAGFDPSSLASDPGYQFRLEQGNKALERSLAAKGMGTSGAALTAAQDYGQGLASQAYNDAFNQWYQKNAGLAGVGQNATGTLVDTYGNLGNIGANAAIGKSNTITGTIAGLTGSDIIGYDANGNPIRKGSSLSDLLKGY